MKRIPLTKGKFAEVDDEDFERLSQYKWHSKPSKGTWYAARDVRRKDCKRTIYMHREILMTDSQVDHKDGDGLNNRRDNLREASNLVNSHNRHRQKNNTSGCVGVSWYRQLGKWKAQLGFRGKDIHLGYFDDKDEAVQAVEVARLRHFEGLT